MTQSLIACFISWQFYTLYRNRIVIVMNLLKQNRQKRAIPTNADLTCARVTPAHSRPSSVCLSRAFVCQLAETARRSSVLPRVISVFYLFLVDVRAIKNNWVTDSNWVLALLRAGVCSQVLQDPWGGWTQARATRYPSFFPYYSKLFCAIDLLPLPPANHLLFQMLHY